MNELNIEAALAEFLGARGRDLASLIGRIVQHLNLQELAGIIDFAHRTKQPLGDIHLVEDRQLHCHPRQLLKMATGHRRTLAVFQVKINDEIAMDPIG